MFGGGSRNPIQNQKPRIGQNSVKVPRTAKASSDVPFQSQTKPRLPAERRLPSKPPHHQKSLILKDNRGQPRLEITLESDNKPRILLNDKVAGR